jgi:hypothetical protein
MAKRRTRRDGDGDSNDGGETGGDGGDMAGLDKWDRLMLKLVDFRLRSCGAEDIRRAAAQIEDFWAIAADGGPLKDGLRLRIEKLRHNIDEFSKQAADLAADQELGRVLDLIGVEPPKPVITKTKRKYTGPIVRPSISKKRIDGRGRISDDEVERFVESMRLNGVEGVFDPSVKIE